MPGPAEIAPSVGTPEVFVRALDLPTPSLGQARQAVAQQIDLLSPLPPAEAAVSVVLLGPAEDGQSRFAAGFAPRASLWPTGGPARPVTLTGKLEGQEIPFRFDPPRDRPVAPVARLEAVTIAGACLAILLAAANLRVDREIDRLQARTDAAVALVQARQGEAASTARVAKAWRAAGEVRQAGVIDCALGDIVKAAGGPVQIAQVSLSGGDLTVTLAQPPSDDAATALRTLGLTAVAAPAAPGPAGSPPPPPAQTFHTTSAECR
ncbi:MAG TPA: hypothetical protein VMT68_19365 [Caulobacteraceae bacterium]|nr:hypothetical protein [Caulobacteraceae bacterium]